MADKTTIEWTDATWNPITGCSVVSPGCTNCYAMRLAGTRMQHHPSRAGLTVETKAGPVWNGEIRFNEEWLEQPLHWRRPRDIFVCAHGDLFHPAVSWRMIDRVVAVMAHPKARHHRFQVLTKRADRMREYWLELPTRIREMDCVSGLDFIELPLPNVWLGVSVEDQQRADERIPFLLGTPAAMRWLSMEPLLGPVNLRQVDLSVDDFKDCGGHPDNRFPRDTNDTTFLDTLSGKWDCEMRSPDGYVYADRASGTDPGLRDYPRGLDWIVLGGESGPGARPMHPDWARSLRDQCAEAGVPFHFKQHGEFAPEGLAGEKWIVGADGSHNRMPTPDGIGHHPPRNGAAFVYRVGKKKAGRILDGVIHDGMPA